MAWKCMEMGTICENVMDWFGFGGIGAENLPHENL